MADDGDDDIIEEETTLIVGEVVFADGEGIEVDAVDVEEKVLALGNAYFPMAFRVGVAAIVVVLLMPVLFDIIDRCKLPEAFFFNTPAGNGGNDLSLFTNHIPLVDESRGGEVGSKISCGVLGIGILGAEEVDEGVFPWWFFPVQD